jgi:hypothetical protein
MGTKHLIRLFVISAVAWLAAAIFANAQDRSHLEETWQYGNCAEAVKSLANEKKHCTNWAYCGAAIEADMANVQRSCSVDVSFVTFQCRVEDDRPGHDGSNIWLSAGAKDENGGCLYGPAGRDNKVWVNGSDFDRCGIWCTSGTEMQFYKMPNGRNRILRCHSTGITVGLVDPYGHPASCRDAFMYFDEEGNLTDCY